MFGRLYAFDANESALANRDGKEMVAAILRHVT
jgi:hypothetical protein